MMALVSTPVKSPKQFSSLDPELRHGHRLKFERRITLLALLAGVFDFVPVLGFILSSVPAVVLGLGVSPLVGLVVAGLYVLYHLIENYYLGPKVYGGKLRLSHLAVILAFAVGAEVGGIIGAILALPVAAMYPVIEGIWLKDYLGRDAVETHRRIERQKA